MAAKDYKICPSLFNAYIAKTSKKNPNDRLPKYLVKGAQNKSSMA